VPAKGRKLCHKHDVDMPWYPTSDETTRPSEAAESGEIRTQDFIGSQTRDAPPVPSLPAYW
jgi:hypothetical protein